jgi:hypothetical protein
MAKPLYQGHSGGHVISFLDAPHGVDPSSQRLEPKVCELCGAGFFRPVQHARAYGERDCPRCRARKAGPANG